MKSDVKVNSKELKGFAEQCYRIFNSSFSKRDVLKQIAEMASKEFGEYFGPDILNSPDEISVPFIEMLDQIIFETQENSISENSINDYINDDLYLRLNIYLDVIIDINLYKNSLSNRRLTFDDTIIIRHFRLKEMVPELIEEFYEQPAIQKDILRALLVFNNEELLNFYYQIVKELHSLEIKNLAILGLKEHSARFKNWHSLRSSDPELNKLVDFAENFNTGKISENKLPNSIDTLFFSVNYIELNLNTFIEADSIKWIFQAMKSVLYINLDNSFFQYIYSSISNILIYFNDAYLKWLLSKEDYMISFICLMDLMPRYLFNRITIKLDNLGKDFIEMLNTLLFSGKIKLDEINSNTMSYMFWEAPAKL